MYKGAFKRVNINLLNNIPEKTKSILDIGCGGGYLLYCLKLIGYEKLVGVDPFIEKDIIYKNGLKVYKKSVFDLDEKFDFIMLHHSFEHMDKQQEVFNKLHELLNDDGTCLLRIPLISYAWEKYRTDWVQLDAPRHFYLHSKDSVALMAEKANLTIDRIVYDSNGFQFRGSEQYKAGIPLIKQKSSFFPREQLEGFEQESCRLNERQNGDQSCFYLKKK